MPIKQRVTTFFDELGEFAVAMVKHWVAFVTGGTSMAVVLMLYERFTLKPIPKLYYIAVLLFGFLCAAYFAWREEYRKRLEAERRVAAAPWVPRRISEPEKSNLRVTLGAYVVEHRRRSNAPQIRIRYEDGGDCAEYAHQFSELFQLCGFEVLPYGGTARIPGHDYHYGLWLRWSSAYFTKLNRPNVGVALDAALKKAALQFTAIDDDGLDVAELIVGHRPPS